MSTTLWPYWYEVVFLVKVTNRGENMKVYQDITLQADADIALGFLWQKLYQKIHIALVEHKTSDNLSAIAVGFPDYGQKGFPLGARLRLFALNQADLEVFKVGDYLVRLTDYVNIKSIQSVPEVTKFASFVRHHVKGKARIEKAEREKAMLWSEKSGKSLESCLKALAKTRPTSDIKEPFVWMESEGTKKSNPKQTRKFPLFIRKIEQKNSNSGKLNCYGLSYSQDPVALPQF